MTATITMAEIWSKPGHNIDVLLMIGPETLVVDIVARGEQLLSDQATGQEARDGLIAVHNSLTTRGYVLQTRGEAPLWES